MKAVKYALLALGAVVLVLGAVLAYVSATFDPNAYKPEIIRLVKEKKQRTLTLAGDISLSFWPNIGAELGKASLSEFRSEKEFAAVDGLRVSVALMPLLSRRVVVDEITVKGARATLVRYKDGRTNIDDLLTKDEREPSQAVEFDIAEVAVENSAFRFRDEAAGATYDVARVDLTTGRIANNVPTRVSLSMTVAATKPKVGLATSLRSKLTFDLDKQLYAFEDLAFEAKGDAAEVRNLVLKAGGSMTAKLATNEFTANGLTVAATGTSGQENFDVRLDAPKLLLTQEKASGDKVTLVAKVTGPQSAVAANLSLPGLEGSARSFKSGAMMLELDLRQGALAVKAQVRSPLSGSIEQRQLSLPALAASLTVSGPAIPGKSLSGELTGSAAVDGAKDSAQANLAGKVGDSTIKARLGLASFKSAAVNFDIDIDQLDLDRYFPPSPAGAKQQQPEKPFDLSGLRNLNASGNVRIGTLKASNLKASNVRIGVKASGGRLNIDPMGANLYGGSLAGAASINAAPATPAFALKSALSGISIGPLLKDLAANDMLEGRGNVTMNVTTQGSTVSALKKALDGTAAVRLADGAVRGIDIAGSIRSARATVGALTGKQTQQVDKAQKTDFTELTASFRIDNGVAHNNDLAMKSPLLRVGGEGRIDIGNDSLDYVVKASVVATSKGQGGRDVANLAGVTVPVRVSGPFTAPSYQLDFGSMVTDAAKQKIEERVTSEIGRRLGGALGGSAGGTSGGSAGKEAGKKESGGSPADVLKGLFGR